MILNAIWGMVVAAVLAGAAGSDAALAYEEISVNNGGTITGKVVLTGRVPELRVFPLVAYPFGPFCKKISDGKGHIVLQEFIVGSGGGLSDAVVVVERVDKGKPFPPISSDFVVVDCMFHPADVPDSEQFAANESGKLRHEHPLVSVIRNPQPISVINKDPIIHNSQVFQSERGNIVLNFPIPVSTEPRGGLIHLQPGKRIAQMICGMHEFMQSWSFAVDNPYYAKTRKNGEFAIDQVPPGTYRVVAWHPHLAPIEREVTVPANGTATVDFEFDGNTVVRPLYETQEKFRIGPEAHPHEHLESCEAPYCDR